MSEYYGTTDPSVDPTGSSDSMWFCASLALACK
jgi:hypothetical protein